MRRVKLRDVSLSISSGLTPNRSNKEFWTSQDICWLKTEQLGARFIYETTEKISKKALVNTSIRVYPEDTVSIAMYGEGRTRGSVSILKSAMATNQACCNIVLNKEAADCNYVYYYLKTQYENLRLLSSGVRKNLNSNDIKDFYIALPNLSSQQKIAAVLSALDDKIELNNRINQELEAMANTLYDYWFVQFDFPDAQGRPYKSSGGKMVYNETLKREIPEGWEVKRLNEYATIKKGTLITEKTADTLGSIKVVSAGLDFSYYHSEANYQENTITISASGANAGYVNFWREPIFACDCTTVRSNTIGSTYYVLEFLRMMQGFIYQQARGSAQPHVYPKDIESLQIALPSVLLLAKYECFIQPLNERVAGNLQQNQTLSSLRDWLLPMLMNGQVRVGAAEEEAEAVIGMAAEEHSFYHTKNK